MEEKTRTIVNIGGKEYKVAGDGSAEYIQRVAACVNSKMRELKGSGGIGTNMTAVLTALNIADDYLKTKDELDKLKEQLEQAKKRSPAPVPIKRR